MRFRRQRYCLNCNGPLTELGDMFCSDECAEQWADGASYRLHRSTGGLS